MKKLFWRLVDHEHGIVGNPEARRPFHCVKCGREVEWDGEWSYWSTVEDAEAKRKRKDDFSKAMGKLNKR